VRDREEGAIERGNEIGSETREDSERKGEQEGE